MTPGARLAAAGRALTRCRQKDASTTQTVVLRAGAQSASPSPTAQDAAQTGVASASRQRPHGSGRSAPQ